MSDDGEFRILTGRAADHRGERPNVAVSVSAGKITALEPIEGLRPRAGDIDARDALLVPGFIDVHVHGGAGRYLMDGTRASLLEVAAHLAHHGVTGFLSTTVTAPWPDQAEALRVAAREMRSPENGAIGAAVLGCHLEGPYINPKRKGAQPGRYILAPSVEDLQRNVGDDLDAVKVMTLAPEMEGSPDLIRYLADRGIVASIGHTDATYDQVSAAIDAGARHVTHCFNAMRPMESREPGVVGAAMSRSELTAELIWDNIHVHPASCRALIAAKSPSGVILISDGIPGTGMPEGYVFDLGDLEVTVKHGSARLPDGTLAGSLLTLDRAFANASAYTLLERCSMSSYTAARSLGLAHRKATIAPGYDADLVLMNADSSVRSTIVNGRTVYSCTQPGT